MTDEPESFFVAGTLNVPGNDAGVCHRCGIAVYPTPGSMQVAVKQGRKVICIECFRKINDFEFGGFIHHGKMLDEQTAERLFRLLMGQKETGKRDA